MTGPDAHDIEYSIISIPQEEGKLLQQYENNRIQSLNDSSLPDNLLEGYIVPINCDQTAYESSDQSHESQNHI